MLLDLGHFCVYKASFFVLCFPDLALAFWWDCVSSPGCRLSSHCEPALQYSSSKRPFCSLFPTCPATSLSRWPSSNTIVATLFLVCLLFLCCPDHHWTVTVMRIRTTLHYCQSTHRAVLSLNQGRMKKMSKYWNSSARLDLLSPHFRSVTNSRTHKILMPDTDQPGNSNVTTDTQKIIHQGLNVTQEVLDNYL